MLLLAMQRNRNGHDGASLINVNLLGLMSVIFLILS